MTHKQQLIRAFVDGAKWWEFTSTGATMWQSDENAAFAEATARMAKGDLPSRLWEILDEESIAEKQREENRR